MGNTTGPKMTLQTVLVLRALLEHPTREFYGLEICGAAGLASGTIHPILARLEDMGWVESRWEDIDPHEKGRPRRRYYRLSTEGAEHARLAVMRAEAKRARFAAARPGFALGGA